MRLGKKKSTTATREYREEKACIICDIARAFVFDLFTLPGL
jgi:hypothetical protein